MPRYPSSRCCHSFGSLRPRPDGDPPSFARWKLTAPRSWTGLGEKPSLVPAAGSDGRAKAVNAPDTAEATGPLFNSTQVSSRMSTRRVVVHIGRRDTEAVLGRDHVADSEPTAAAADEHRGPSAEVEPESDVHLPIAVEVRIEPSTS